MAGWLWLVVHLAFIAGFKNRLASLANWAVAFLGRGGCRRTITKQHVLTQARTVQPERLGARNPARARGLLTRVSDAAEAVET